MLHMRIWPSTRNTVFVREGVGWKLILRENCDIMVVVLRTVGGGGELCSPLFLGPKDGSRKRVCNVARCDFLMIY
jgi:hypothetical protein